MSRPFFSLIIPIHNTTDEFITRLFDSIKFQAIDKEDLEIIVVDDASDNGYDYRSKIDTYDLNVKYAETNTEIHCPGNTRRKGMELVTGEWLCFADQDDYFEDYALSSVKEFIQTSDHTIYCLMSQFKQVDEPSGEVTASYSRKTAWLHGKWYNMDCLIKPFKINFKEDLASNEDLYFNCSVINTLITLGTDYDYLDKYTYRWVNNPDSISRKPTENRGYLFETFSDYLMATTEPYWESAIKTKDSERINQIMMTLLHAYFYYEAAVYNYNSNEYGDILQMICSLATRIMQAFNCTYLDIIKYVYADAERYNVVRDDCEVTCGNFITNTSFRDFMYRLFLDL